MNRANPFIAQGSFLDDAAKRRRKVRIAVFAVLALFIILLLGLLIGGCRHP
jgi:predicted nucleic acid-binding Zn ribbon protein